MLFLKKIIKYVIALIFHYSGINCFLLWKPKKIFIFMFHKICKDTDYLHMSIQPDELKIIIEWSENYGKIISMNQIFNNEKSEHQFCITFDDGYKNNLEFIKLFPGVKAIIYLASSFIGTGKYFWADRIQSLILFSTVNQLDLDEFSLGIHDLSTTLNKKQTITKLNVVLKKLSLASIENIVNDINDQLKQENDNKVIFLSWDDVKHLCENGIDIGSHTHNHVITSKISLTELQYELTTSNAIISENTNKPVLHFAYPNGTKNDICENYKQILSAYGYTTAVSTIEGSNDKNSDPFLLKRINVTRSRITSPFGFISKAMFTTLLTNPFGIH